ncbi:hypothetical protein EW145_g7986 [Phellinidium pouzarii]|uniref:Protein kinase domain-containing protein n=1 Tax=Phellinidium pouzarii TaxID=167371 RepID=A0A4S4KBB9_9AGAM|nr:hypothetical protein EW145_g7986 [Phellinidium pouzarii]
MEYYGVLYKFITSILANALFHPHLVTLHYKLGKLDEPIEDPSQLFNVDADLLEASHEFFVLSLAIYESEKDRSTATGDFFKQAFDGQGHERRPYYSNNGDLIGAPDAIWGTECKSLNRILPHVMIECKDEQGTGNSGDETFFETTNFPMILICIYEPALSIYSALLLERVVVNNLLTLNLAQYVDRDVVVLKIARIHSVLKECALLIKTENDQIVDQVVPGNPPRRYFPDPTSNPPSNLTPLPKLTYRGGLHHENKLFIIQHNISSIRCLYAADPLPDWYNETAHKLLAEVKLAPKLYFFQRMIGDRYMVVMERLEGLPMSLYSTRAFKTKLERSVFDDIESALTILHAKCIVHGDLRAENIIIDPERKHAKVVDFGWAGKSGKARYPATINEVQFKTEWDFDVNPGGIMDRSHGRFALQHLRHRDGPPSQIEEQETIMICFILQ